MKAVIDSDVLMDYLQGVNEAKIEISRYSDPLYSIISWMEMMCGAQTDHERMRLIELLYASSKPWRFVKIKVGNLLRQFVDER